jgi:hypothetical protein
MAEKDLETEKLELSLFGRKRKGKKRPDPEDQTPAAVPAPEPEEPGSAAPAEQAPVEAAHAETPTSSSGDPADADPPTTEVPTVPAASSTETPTTVIPATPAAAGEATAPVGAGATAVRPAPEGRATSGSPRRERRSRGTRAARKAPRRPVRVPSMPAQSASLLVGGLVGLAAVVLTYVSLQACELVAGTASCGGPGLFVLLAVVVLMILAGSAALSMLGVPESGGLSFLGVAMFVAVCLVVLLPNLLELWMIVVAPVLCALTFLAAHWIVTRFDEEILETDGPRYDVR